MYCHPTTQLAKEPQGELYCSDSHGTANSRYDLPQGTLSVNVNSGWSLYATVTADDDFTVTGIPDGTPLTFKATLQVSVSRCTYDYNCCMGFSHAVLSDGTVADEAYPPGALGCTSKRDTLVVPISRLAGETFRLRMIVDANSVEAGSGSASGKLSFVDLPPEAIVTSCHGFSQGGTTPVVRTSWGTLKLRYR
jgi:hypothetical protein